MEILKKYISPILLLLTTVIWGVSFVAQKEASYLPPLTLCACRAITASVALLPATAAADKFRRNGRHLINKETGKPDFTKNELIGGIICGTVLFAASSLQQIGISSTDAGKTSFITALYVVIVPMLSLIFGKKSSLFAYIGVVLAAVGFYFLCISKNLEIAPSDLIILLGAFAFAIQIIVIDLFGKDSDGFRMSLIQFTAFALLSTLFALIFERPIAISQIIHALPKILYLGILSSAGAYTLQILGQKNTHPTAAALILSLEAVFGVIASAILLGERLSGRELAGCAVVLAALIISQLPAPVKKTDRS